MELETGTMTAGDVAYGVPDVQSAGAVAPQEGVSYEALTGNLLRYGVFLSIAVCVLGSIAYFIAHGLGGNVGPLIRYSAHPAFPHSVAALAGGIGRFGPSSIIVVGLLMLVALRVLQVLLSAAVFALHRNFRFVFVSLFVFAVLMSSLFLGKAGG